MAQTQALFANISDAISSLTIVVSKSNQSDADFYHELEILMQEFAEELQLSSLSGEGED